MNVPDSAENSMEKSINTISQNLTPVIRYMEENKLGRLRDILLLIVTLICLSALLLCCVFLARYDSEIRLRCGLRRTKLTDEQRRAILEFLFPDNLKIAQQSKLSNQIETAPDTPKTHIDTLDSEEEEEDEDDVKGDQYNTNRLKTTGSFLSVFPLRTYCDNQDITQQRIYSLPLPRFSTCEYELSDLGCCEHDVEQNATDFEKNINNIEANVQCCSICLDGYNQDDNIVFSKRCTHFFHKECIMPWLLKTENNKFSCPSCRQNMINIDDLREATSKVIGDNIHIDDGFDEDASLEDRTTNISPPPGRFTGLVYANESPAFTPQL